MFQICDPSQRGGAAAAANNAPSLDEVLHKVPLYDGIDGIHGRLLRQEGLVVGVGPGVTLGLLAGHVVTNRGEERRQVLQGLDGGHGQLRLTFDQRRGLHIFYLFFRKEKFS